MQNLSVSDFVDTVVAWASNNVDRISLVWPLAGGWEAWAQAEIAGYINANTTGSWVAREPGVYPDGSRSDFLVNNPEFNDPRDEIVVEMKCESFRNWKNFVEGLRYDTWKLHGDLKDELKGAKKVSVGIFFSPESERQLEELSGYTLYFTSDNTIGLAFLTW